MIYFLKVHFNRKTKRHDDIMMVTIGDHRSINKRKITQTQRSSQKFCIDLGLIRPYSCEQKTCNIFYVEFDLISPVNVKHFMNVI